MKSKNPLVTVFIVTYNSQNYIIEALESVKSQTYQNIELVVSDDCSKDDTLKRVKEWVCQNGERFIRTTVVESPINTGTSANYNRAVRACHGEWLKMLDGDDIITPNCIDDNLNFIAHNPDVQVVFSNYIRFAGNKPGLMTSGDMSPKAKFFFSLPQQDQTKYLLRGNILPSQTCFIKASILKENPYNEKYRLLEDYPMWLHLSDIGIPFYYFDIITALYRQEDSVSKNRKELFPRVYTEMKRDYFLNDMMNLITKYNEREAYDYLRKYFLWYDFCSYILKNKKNQFTHIVYMISKVLIFKCLRFNI